MPWFFEPTPDFSHWLDSLQVGSLVSLANAHSMRIIPITREGVPVQRLSKSRVTVTRDFYSRKSGLYMPPSSSCWYSFDGIVRIVPVGFHWSLLQEISTRFQQAHDVCLDPCHVEVVVSSILGRVGNQMIGSNSLISLALKSLESQVFVNPGYLGNADLDLGDYLRICHGAPAELHSSQHPWVPRSIPIHKISDPSDE